MNLVVFYCRYLVGGGWIRQWKKYVGYDKGDQYDAGKESANPGPVDNSNLLKSQQAADQLFFNGIVFNADPYDDDLNDWMSENWHYNLLPAVAWKMLTSWYGISEGSRPVPRLDLLLQYVAMHVIALQQLCTHSKVAEFGSYRECKVEVYLYEFKLGLYPNQDELVVRHFSRADTVGKAEEVLIAITIGL